MPLVVPGINNNAGSNDPKSEWMNKLMGKKLSDSTTDSTVRPPSSLSLPTPRSAPKQDKSTSTSNFMHE